jgi:hypothetical protein
MCSILEVAMPLFAHTFATLPSANPTVEEEVNQLKEENVKLQGQLVDLNKSVNK